jgi:hypothetical protein
MADGEGPLLRKGMTDEEIKTLLPDAPKRVSAYRLFTKMKFSDIQKAHPGRTQGHYMTLVRPVQSRTRSCVSGVGLFHRTCEE